MTRNYSLHVLFISLSFVMIAYTANVFGQDVSAEARRHMNRGLAAIESAVTDGDLQDAIKEFEAATGLAPDWPDPYFNLGKVQEKVGRTSDAIASYEKYLALAPNAQDAQEVRQLVDKLQYKADKEARLKKVYEMMVSPTYDRKYIGEKYPVIFISPMTEMGLVNGKMVAYNYYKRLMNDRKLAASLPNWFSVTVNGRFYEYRFTYYQCDLVGSRDEGAPPYCPFDVSVKGEITSVDPPQIKEVVTVKASWSSSPNPAGCPTGVGEWVWAIVPK